MTYTRGSLQRHEELKHLILRHPELVGIAKEDIIAVETEYALTKRKRAIAKPDLLITYKCERGVCRRFVEIKSGSCRRAQQSLNMQLRKISKYCKWNRISADAIGVYPGGSALRFMMLS